MQNLLKLAIDNGIVWVGPPPSAISALANKAKAREIALGGGPTHTIPGQLKRLSLGARLFGRGTDIRASRSCF